MSSESYPYKDVISFLIKFVGLYLILNVVYGIFIEYYRPEVDPFTWLVSVNVATLLAFFDDTISLKIYSGSPYIGFLKGTKIVIRAFEGCNGINVMIVFVAFLFAFKGPLKKTMLFLLIGLGIIHIMNLLRVSLLYEVALHIPAQLYFYHKYLFTGVLYLTVFVLWYFWVKQIRRIE